MDENQIAKIVVDTAYHIHRKFGPGLFEIVYEVILVHELRKRGLDVQRQIPVPLRYDSIEFEQAFVADVIVNGKVLLELKSLDEISQVHRKQVLTYLRLTRIRLGLLINFGADLIKDGITRVVNKLND